MQVRAALREAVADLAVISDTARLDAELLMAHALGVSRSEMLVRLMDADAPGDFDALVKRRQAEEPIAYITGWQEFFGLAFSVGPDVLIPRGDSEVLVAAALTACPGARRVLDCGTGSGALLIATLANLSQAEGVGIDRSGKAVKTAAQNAASHGIASAVFLERDWTEPGWADDLGTFDLILANPPYVETGADLSRSVQEYEPAGALFAGLQGLDAYRVLIPQLPGLLRPQGLAFVEIGAQQASLVSEIAGNAGFAAQLHRDLANRPRVLQLSRRW